MNVWFGHVKIGTFKKTFYRPLLLKVHRPTRLEYSVRLQQANNKGCRPTIVLLVRQLRHAFTKTAIVSPNSTDAHVASGPCSDVFVYGLGLRVGQDRALHFHVCPVEGLMRARSCPTQAMFR